MVFIPSPPPVAKAMGGPPPQNVRLRFAPSRLGRNKKIPVWEFLQFNMTVGRD